MNQTDGHPVVLITGAARRIGAVIAQTLHAAGYNVVIHCLHSAQDAWHLAEQLNAERAHSAQVLQSNLLDLLAVEALATQAAACWGRLDALVNSASAFYPTPIGQATARDWDELVGSNLRAPFFLAQACAPALRAARGAIVNISDIHAEKPLRDHALYCMAKAGNNLMTQALAMELAPDVRVNAVAPGAILWPEQGGAVDAEAQQQLLARVPLARCGTPADIAATVLFLLRDASYISGQIVAVDGGRSTVR